MYNINNHYDFVLQYANLKGIATTLGYFFPFGATKFTNIEFLGTKNPDIALLCYDQEPIDFTYNKDTFSCYSIATTRDFNDSSAAEAQVFSKFLQNIVTVEYQKIIRHKPVPIILLNTEKDSEEKNKVLKKFNFIDSYYFFHGLAAIDWFRGYQYCVELLPLRQRKIKKTFISFNRIIGNSRIYRAFFVSLLNQKNLLEYGNVSFSKICPLHGALFPSVQLIPDKYNLDKDNFTKSFKQIDLLPDLRIDSPVNSQIENKSYTLGSIPKLIESFVHVVTETCFWDTKKHLTEKIFKPIVAKQPFLLLGCKNNLSYLREYGFKTFSNWWSEDYDECSDPFERIEMVVKIINDLTKLSNQQLENLLIEMEDVLEHNYNLFYSKNFVEHILNELYTNLDLAIVQAQSQNVPKNPTLHYPYIDSHTEPSLYQIDKLISHNLNKDYV
jgi:hypothetical protein